MKVINISVSTDKIIRLGRRGEGNVRQIVFDCTCFAETYGSGTAQLLHRRRGDEAPYPVLIEQNDNIVTWTVQESDTANVGIGEAEIIWMLPDGNAKSAVYETETLRSLSEPGDPPEPWQAWVDEVLKAAESGGATPEQIAGAVERYLAEHPIEETDPTVPEWAKHPEKPTYTASEVGADTIGTSESKVSEHNVSDAAHNDIRLLVQGLMERLNALADSDDTTLDQMSEVVAYIKSNKSLIDAITTSKVNVSDIIDNLVTNVSNKPLSAAQGVALKALIDAIAVPTKLSELENDSGYAKTTDIPDKLPNPQKLTFAGAVTAEYNGSGAVTVTIPGSGGTVRIEKLSTDTVVELEPNKLYIFPEMAELTITLAEPSDTGIANEYHFAFQSGATATTLSIPDTVKIPSGFSVDVNKIYEVSILEGCLCAQSWAVTA